MTETTTTVPLEIETLDNDEAMQLFSETGNYLVLDVPPGTEFGIDLRSWIVGERFSGFKFVPPGIHYVYWR